MNIEHSDAFGNYLIHGIDEIILPDAISWWPAAPGWKAVAVVLGLWLIIKAARSIKRWWRHRYRRQALRELAALEKKTGADWQKLVVQLPFYLKATALQAWPRQDIASLSGQPWLDFLHAHCSKVSFPENMDKALLAVSYWPPEQWSINEAEGRQLLDLCRRWIALHEVSDV